MNTKAFMISATLVLLASVLLSMQNQVQAESFTATWAGYEFCGVDSFYNETVVAYKSSSTAVLYVSVIHNYSTYTGMPINVSAVGISLNWGDMFNSTQANQTNTVALDWEESRIFTITFKVASTVNASNLFMWDYEVYLEHTDGNGTVVDRDVKTRRELELPYFAVYSAEQAKSKQIAETINGIKKELGSTAEWNSTRAEVLWKRAMNTTNVAEYFYELGEFFDAYVNYESALGLIDKAFSAEENRGTALEDAKVDALDAQVKETEAWANFANGLSNLWTLVGVALVLFALGYIIRGLAELRRTPVPS
jgi:hypothetical protein